MKTVLTQLQIQQFRDRSELMFALPMPQFIRALIACLQSSIKAGINCKMNCSYMNNFTISSVYSQSISRMQLEEKLQYYGMVTDCIINTVNANNLSQQRLEQTILFNSNVKLPYCLSRPKTVQYSSLTHMLWVAQQPRHRINQQNRQNNQFQNKQLQKQKQNIPVILKQKSYWGNLKYGAFCSSPFIINLSQYLCRRSKIKTNPSIVLQAIDERIGFKYRTIRFQQFQSTTILNYVYETFKKSIGLKMNQFIRSVYVGDAIRKNAINSLRKPISYEIINSNTGSSQQGQSSQLFYSYQDFNYAGGDSLQNQNTNKENVQINEQNNLLKDEQRQEKKDRLIETRALKCNENAINTKL